MKVKSDTLNGAGLIWAMCVALGHSPVVAATGVTFRGDHGSWEYPRFTDDAEIGPLMASEWVGVDRPSKGQNPPVWRAITDVKYKKKYGDSLVTVVSAYDPSLAIAVCRAIVMSRLGEVVELPDEYELIKDNKELGA